MSGHSKWSQIKRKKEVNDKKRSQIFSKLLKAISIASRGDQNPQFNPRLRSAIEKAKESNVPNENIERAIKKSAESGNLEELLIEAYGPEGVGMILEAISDNKNRTISEIKKIFNDNDIKWADQGSVLWAFERSEDGYVHKFPQEISKESEEKLLRVMDILDDHDDVSNIFVGAKFSE